MPLSAIDLGETFAAGDYIGNILVEFSHQLTCESEQHRHADEEDTADSFLLSSSNALKDTATGRHQERATASRKRPADDVSGSDVQEPMKRRAAS